MFEGFFDDLPITPRRRKVLELILAHQIRFGCAPTVRDIADGLGGVNTNAAFGHIKALMNLGYIARGSFRGHARNLRITEAAFPSPVCLTALGVLVLGDHLLSEDDALRLYLALEKTLHLVPRGLILPPVLTESPVELNGIDQNVLDTIQEST